MRFWEDMQSKYGFSDGEAMPDGIEVYREVYIRAVNQLAEQLNSGVRVVAFNRAGVHNWCLILMHHLSDLQAQHIEDFTAHVNIAAETCEADESLEEAIRQANELELDSLLEVTVTVADDFELFIEALHPIKEGDPLIAEVNGEMQHFYAEGRIRLVQEVTAFDGSVLPVGSEYIITWVEQRAEWINIALSSSEHPIAFAATGSAMVLEIPVEIRESSTNNAAVPPYYLRELKGETLGDYGQFYTLAEAQAAVQRIVSESCKTVEIINGYGNTFSSFEADDKGG
ncbi:MAG: hypothetical protein GC179_24495 [Anaerolineaceae bacterium]|nr:hypothetical protein [Anaerolineaceae bacterium]